jgi:cytoskeletal protein CcmA (bactofilin family)
MFKRTDTNRRFDDREPTMTPSANDSNDEKPAEATGKTSQSTARSVSYIGPDLHFTGNISAKEGLVIEGTFEGKLIQEDRSLTIGKRGRINGLIQAGEIEVRGHIEGEIYATERIRLYSGCVVTGKIYCKNISTEEGAIFNGTIDMSQEVIKPEATKLELAAGKDAPAAKKRA